MTDNVISLIDRVASRKPQIEHEPDEDDGICFLLEEGLDLLASYRSIPDQRARLRLKAVVDEVAGDPTKIPGIVSADVVSLNAPAKPSRWAELARRGSGAAAFGALLLGASIVLEIADPATTDVAASVLSAPSPIMSP